MRRFVIHLGLALFLIACTSSPTAEKSDIEADSLLFNTTIIEKINQSDLVRYQTQLHNIFDKKLLSRNFNGAIIVAKGGNILYENYVGFSNPRTKTDPITDSTSFHLASTSKPFTGVAILKLVQEHKINLSDDIRKYFPEFPYANVTVRDLLSHRSGLPNYLYFMDDKEKWPAGQMVYNQDVLEFMIQHQPKLSYKSGTHFSYCNTNYVLLALLLEKVTGVPYPQYMRQTIFKPLGMDHTFVYTPSDSGKVILSYKPSGALWEYDIFDNTYGDKNIYSTPKDMLKWDAALYNEKFIDPAILDSAYQPQSHETPSIHNYGLGWRMLNLPNGKNVIYHNGKWHGFNPAFARLLDEKAVIVILGNQYNTNIYNAAKLAYNVFGSYMQNEPDIVEPAPVATPPSHINKEPKRTLNPTINKTTKTTSGKNISSKTSSSKNKSTVAKKTSSTSTRSGVKTKKKK